MIHSHCLFPKSEITADDLIGESLNIESGSSNVECSTSETKNDKTDCLIDQPKVGDDYTDNICQLPESDDNEQVVLVRPRR